MPFGARAPGHVRVVAKPHVAADVIVTAAVVNKITQPSKDKVTK